MSATPGAKVRGLIDLLSFPVGTALLVLGLVRLLLSAARSCQELACDDFGRFWYATGSWLNDGHSLYAPTPASYINDGLFYANLNLPHTHLLFVPFSGLGRDAAAALWLVTGAMAVALAARLVATEVGWRPTRAWILVFIWWMPTHVQVINGQLAWVMLPVIAFAWRSARRQNWLLTGASLGVAVALKPFLAPLVAWLLWRRRFDAVVAAVATAASMVAAGVLVFGLRAYDEWWHTAMQVDWYSRSTNASIWGGTFRLLAENPQFAHVVRLEWMLPWVGGGLAAAIVAACWRLCRATGDVDRQWSLVLCASLLLSPLGWVYYGVWLLPGQHFRWPGAVATALWLIPTPLMFLMQPSPIATLLWGSAATWGLLLAFVHIAHSTASEARPQAIRLEAAS